MTKELAAPIFKGQLNAIAHKKAWRTRPCEVLDHADFDRLA
jgi:hypothetical protein